MKFAITGKGGVGKTTVTALLARAFLKDKNKIFLVDADPSPSLGLALGIPERALKKLIPISEMSELIHERTGVAPGSSYGAIFKLNPKVDDIPEKFSIETKEGMKLLVVGTIKAAGAGCFCPENALIKRLLKHLIIAQKEVLIMDMEAGIEHLGRGTIKSMDLLVIVLEPGLRSVKVAEQIKHLGEDLGIDRFGAVLNKVQDPTRDMKIIGERLSTLAIPILGAIPFNPNLITADLTGEPPHNIKENDDVLNEVENIRDKIQDLIK